ncbi:hypothetical protein SNE40_006427 [Patella caerulea]|uniref:Right handed beta helix domain-containing protein n=1 Tax=Patella caerulea TaxID=87958 RepID=A0AAN8Q122_PATCE
MLFVRKKVGGRIMLRIAVILVLLPTTWAAAIHLYVSPQGSDTNTGLDPSTPLKTLQRARDRIDEPGILGNEIYVELMSGYHDLLIPLNLTHGYTALVTFRSYQHEEVHVTGGKRITPSLFKPVTDPVILERIPEEAHEKVRQIHLPDAGITDYGTMSVYGFYRERIAPLELFINGNPLRLARWPNDFFINIVSVPDGRRGVRFGYNNSRDARWVGEKEPWAYGYWFFSWADQSAEIASVNTSSHEITLTAPTKYGLKTGHLQKKDNIKVGDAQQGGYFRVINMLSELDQPGEYYIDRSTGILYMWPNTPTGYLNDSDIIYASILDDCISIAKGANNITFQDFTIQACRRFGIDGTDLESVSFLNLEAKNLGSYGIRSAGDSRNITVSGCEIHDTDGGINVSGGDRIDLIPSGNVIEDNHIYKVGRETSVGADGISHSGVNNIIRNNYLHHGTYSCIMWSGNDHIMEYNHFEDCCQNATDGGAVHCGRDWTMRGNHIRYNYFQNTLRTWPGGQIRGIMLDDEFSSVTIEHNVFFTNEVHANIGGGRDTIIRYNVFYNATEISVDVDGRGLNGSDLPELEAALKAVPYTDALWSSRYPKLAAMAYDKVPGAPRGNQIYKNIYYTINGTRLINYHRNQIYKNIYYMVKGSKLISYHGAYLANSTYFNLTDNFQVQSSDFVDPEKYNFQLQGKAKAWAAQNGFDEPIPFNQVGPRFAPGPTYLNKGMTIL